MVIVLVLFGIFAAEFGIAMTAGGFIALASPEFQSMVQEVASSGNTDPQALLQSSEYQQVSIPDNLATVITLIAALLTLPMVLIIRGKRALSTDLVAVNQKANALSILKALLLILAIGAAANLLAFLTAPFFESLMEISFTEFLEDSISGILTSPVGILYVALLGPIIEEIIFRGAILNRLSRHGVNFAIVTQALLFGLFHGIIFQSFCAFFIGLVLGYVAMRYSLKWAMVLHIANNSISVGFTLLDQAAIGPVADIIFWVYLIACLVGAVVLLIVKRKQFSVIRQYGLAVTPKPYQIAFSSPLLVTFMAVYLSIGILTLFLTKILDAIY